MLSEHTKSERLRNLVASGADPYVGKRELAALRGVSLRTIDRLVAKGKIPKGELIGLRKVGWRLSVVNSLI
jgi:predicted DNA-binding transcriptional regulator AlpA